MWMLNNSTSYAAERNWIRDKTGQHHWLVAVKATFDIAPNGKLTLADEQPPPLLAPEFRGDPATTSLLLDSDLLGRKPGTEIVLDAVAHAPGGKPAPHVQVTLHLGTITKTLVVHGTRVYYHGLAGLSTSAPRPFVTSPICYENAFGGSDTSHPDPRTHKIDLRNPVGRGIAIDSKKLDNQLAHSVEFPDGNFTKVGPAGFGPIASSWSPRVALAGTYDQHWEKSKKPLLPDDYDDLFTMSSPADQRFAKPIPGGEVMALLNMSPSGTLRFTLPKIFLAFSSRFGRRAEEHRATLASVLVMPEKMKLSLVWQSSLEVKANQVDYLDETIITEKAYIS